MFVNIVLNVRDYCFVRFNNYNGTFFIIKNNRDRCSSFSLLNEFGHILLVSNENDSNKNILKLFH